MKSNHFINDLTHENYRLKREIERLHRIIQSLHHEIEILKSVNVSSLETHSRVLNYMKNKNAELKNKGRAIMPDISGDLHHVNINYSSPLVHDISVNPMRQFHPFLLDSSGNPILMHPIQVKSIESSPINQTTIMPPMPPRLVPPPLKSMMISPSTTHPSTIHNNQEERDFHYNPHYNNWNRYPWLYPYPYLGDWYHGEHHGEHHWGNHWGNHDGEHHGGYHSD